MFGNNNYVPLGRGFPNQAQFLPGALGRDAFNISYSYSTPISAYQTSSVPSPLA